MRFNVDNHHPVRCCVVANADPRCAGAGETGLAPNPLMRGMAGGDYVRSAIASVKPGNLEAALLCLPFADALRLLPRLAEWLATGAQVCICSFTSPAAAFQCWICCNVAAQPNMAYIARASGNGSPLELVWVICSCCLYVEFLSLFHQVELGCRVAVLLVRLHRQQLLATPSARRHLLHLHRRLHAQVGKRGVARRT